MDSRAAKEEEGLEMLQQEYQRVRERRAQAEEQERMLEQRLKQARSQSSQDSSSQQRRHSGMATSYSQQLGGRNGRPDGGSRRATVSAPGFGQQSLGVNTSRPDKMMRSQSNQTAPTQNMARSMSHASENSSSPLGGSGHGGARRFGGVSTGMLSSLYQDEPANVQMLRRSSRLPDVREDSLGDIGINPIDYLKNMGMDDDTSMNASGASTQSIFSHSDLLSYYEDSQTLSSSQAPSLVSGGESIATANAQPLSRQGSSVEGSLLNAFALHRLDSNMSTSMERMSSNDVYGFPMPPNTTKGCFTSEDLLGIGGGLAPPAESAEMSRTLSNMSSVSNSSARSTASHQERRAKEARERQIQNSLRNVIAPRPLGSDESNTSSGTSSSKKDGKVALTKTSYQRPKHPRVYCNKCSEHPEGFRGQHELARHVSAKHSPVVVKWICRDPHAAGIRTDITAVNPLSKCKACKAMKQYGAYYNAAAHLRRTHFRPKPSRSKSKNNAKEEKRAGAGGGDFPPMNELKLWMVRVQVRDGNISTECTDDAQTAGDEAGDVLDLGFNEYPMDMNPAYGVPSLSVDATTPESTIISSGSHDFDISLCSSPSAPMNADMAFPMEYSSMGDDYSLMFET